RLELIGSRAHDPRLDSQALRQVLRVRDELLRVSERVRGQSSLRRAQASPPGDTEGELLKLVLYAYPDRVCRRRGGTDRGVMVGGGGVRLAVESVVKQ